MIKSRIAVAGALLAVAGAASAGSFSVTPTIASDYDWRGVSQTEPDQDGDVAPAFQLGGTYSADNGFYVGAWGSNVDFGPGDPSVEIDLFAGFSGGDSEESFGYDFGVNYYTYMSESDLNFFELYAGISKGMFSGKLWWSPEFGGDGNDSALYVEGNVAYPLPNNFSLLAHVGYSFGSYWKPDEYLDYSVGVGYDVGNFSLALKYVDTDVNGWNGEKLVASVSTTLPW